MLVHSGHQVVELAALAEEAQNVVDVGVTVTVYVIVNHAAHFSELLEGPLVVANQLIGAFHIVCSCQSLVEVQSACATIVNGGDVTGGVEHTVGDGQLGVCVLVPPGVVQIDGFDLSQIQQITASGALPDLVPLGEHYVILIEAAGNQAGNVIDGGGAGGVLYAEIVLVDTILQTDVNGALEGIGLLGFNPNVTGLVVTEVVVFAYTEDAEVGTAEVGLSQGKAGFLRNGGIFYLGVGCGGSVRGVRGFVTGTSGENRNQHEHCQKHCKNTLHHNNCPFL